MYFPIHHSYPWFPGFDGLNCERNITDCHGGICPDDYTLCSDLSKNNSCNSIGSKTVKSLIDPCASSPCNNGTCFPVNGGYTCTCQEGITGSNCDIDINECDQNQTICNFGICYNIVG